MINKVLILAAFAVSSMLSGCLDKSDTPAASSGTVLAANISGGTTDITGTWAFGCYKNEGETDKQVFYIISSGSVTVMEKIFSSTDATCTGTETGKDSAIASLVLGATAAVIGWADAGGNVGATAVPTAQDNSGPLSATEAFTPLDITVTELTGNYLTSGQIKVGDKKQLGLIIDATGAKAIAYATFDEIAADDTKTGKRYAKQNEVLTR